MCCSTANWKREVVPDHKFDYIDLTQFHSKSCGTRLQYLWLYILVGKSFAVYVADVYTAIALLASDRWAASVLQSEAAKNGKSSSGVLEVPFSIGKWIFTGCIIFSFLLLLWEARKTRAIVKSRDISYAFTNVMSQNYYSLRSYDHFCFFCQINNSKKKKDEFAFFIFFTFKGWKRLLLADAPRQVINAITLYSFGKSEGWTTDISVYFGGSILKAGIIITMLFTLVIFVGSAILLLVAAVMYVPLLCYIQGNLKEYCCHKVDKRIAELMKRKTRKRLAKEAEIARKEARGDFSHLRDKKTGKFTAAPLPQPTLPKVGLGDGDLYAGGRGNGFAYPPAPSTYASSERQGLALHDRSMSGPLSRPGYAYEGSDPNLMRHEYADSVHSTDGFAGRGAPMGYDSQTSLVGPDGRPNLVPGRMGASGHSIPSGLSRAPTYRSDDMRSINDEKMGYVEEYGAPSPNALPYQQHAYSRSQESTFSRQPSQREPDRYQAPSRQQLYERTALQRSDSSLAYDRNSGAYGGAWEDQERELVEQEYYTSDRAPYGGQQMVRQDSQATPYRSHRQQQSWR